MTPNVSFPAEWYPQSGIQLTWPHPNTDWAYMLDEVTDCYKKLASEIFQREKLIIVTPYPDEVKKQLQNTIDIESVRFIVPPTIHGHEITAVSRYSKTEFPLYTTSNSTAGDLNSQPITTTSSLRLYITKTFLKPYTKISSISYWKGEPSKVTEPEPC